MRCTPSKVNHINTHDTNVYIFTSGHNYGGTGLKLINSPVVVKGKCQGQLLSDSVSNPQKLLYFMSK